MNAPRNSPDERQRAGQIVDLVEHAGADDEVEAGVGEGQPFLVALHPAGGAGEGQAGVEAGDARAGWRREGGVEAAEIEYFLEPPGHRRQPFVDTFQHGHAQEVMGGVAGLGAVAAQAAGGAIEDGRRRHAAQACAPGRDR